METPTLEGTLPPRSADCLTGNVTARGKDNQGGARFHTTMTFKVVEQEEGGAVSRLQVRMFLMLPGLSQADNM